MIVSPTEDRRENSLKAGSSRDVDIAAEAEERLRRSGYLALRDVSCHERDGVVQLRGRLHSHYLKQVAQEMVAGMEGVDRVDNLIEVRSSSSTPPKAGVTESNVWKPQSPEGLAPIKHPERSPGRC